MRKKFQLTLLFIIQTIFFCACGNTKTEFVSTEENNELLVEINSEISDSEDSININSVSTETEEAEPVEINIIMVGDMLLHTPIEEASLKEDGRYDYSPIFEHTKDLISEADIAIANQEVILGGLELGVKGYPAFNAPYEFGDELVDVGFDVVCHGTNHALDKKAKGLSNCLSFWNETHPEIGVLGIHDSAEDQNEIYIYECEGIKIAILNYTYGTNGNEMPKSMPFAVDILKEKRVIDDLKTAEEIADFTIVCPHWGTEYRLTADSSQKKWASLMVQNGADLILGTHPHVVEPVEWLTDDETGNKALCYYSLGNFVNWTSGKGEGVSNRMLGAMADVTLSVDDDGNVYVKTYGVTPLVSHVTSGSGGVTVYPLYEYSNELAEKNEIQKQASDFSYNYLTDLADDIFGDLIKDKYSR